MGLNLKLSFGLVLLAVCGVLYYNAFVANQPCKHKLHHMNDADKIPLTDSMMQRLIKALSIKTVSSLESQDKNAILDYIKFIRKEFVSIEKHSFVTFTLINEYSILYKVQGKNPSLNPYLLAAHLDVVPVIEEEWQYAPFGEINSDGFIYGRGTMDDKGSMISQLEAVDRYLQKFGQPQRTFYLAYGHDEELSGEQGAKNIARHLGNITLEYVLDEGTLIIEDIFPELGKPVALISIADKGYLTIKFTVNTTGGHSSMPDNKNSAIFILAEAITKLNHNLPPSLLGKGPELQTLNHLAVNMGFFKRILLTNLWLFKPIVDFVFSQKPSTNAVLRTTTSVNVFRGGIKDNVLPSYGEFYLNHRIHSAQSCKEMIDYDLKVINDKRISYEIISCVEPSPVSSTNSLGYMLIDHSTREVYNDVYVIPSIMVGLTDSRYYYNLTSNIYKYLPMKVSNDDLKGYHGVNERISKESYKNMINFYFSLIKNTDEVHLKKEKAKNDEL